MDYQLQSPTLPWFFGEPLQNFANIVKPGSQIIGISSASCIGYHKVAWNSMLPIAMTTSMQAIVIRSSVACSYKNPQGAPFNRSGQTQTQWSTHLETIVLKTLLKTGWSQTLWNLWPVFPSFLSFFEVCSDIDLRFWSQFVCGNTLRASCIAKNRRGSKIMRKQEAVLTGSAIQLENW